MLGTDVLVNNPALDTTGTTHTQSETTLARNETTGTVCSGYNDSSGVTPGHRLHRLQPLDRRRRDLHGPRRPRLRGGQATATQPGLAQVGRALLLRPRAHHGCASKSTADCQPDLGRHGPAGASDDKELMAVDNNVGQPLLRSSLRRVDRLH